MEKIYFAGKFNLHKDKSKTLSERLTEDYRSLILKSSNLLVNATSNLKLNDNYIYNGPFYCEEASKGNFTSTDCNIVLNAEYQSVKSSDIYVVVFDRYFSVGSIVELGWAISMNKKIIILYEEESNDYTIKSEYWFAIADALKRANDIEVKSFKNKKEIVEYIEEFIYD